MSKKEKKKKGCLGRLISGAIKISIFLVAAIFIYFFIFDDSGDYEDFDYISQQEIDAGNEDISFADLMDIFFDYYGYYPDDDDNSDYNYNDYYDNSDYANYNFNHSENDYDNFYDKFDRNNSYSDYYNDVYDQYSDTYNNLSDDEKEVYGMYGQSYWGDDYDKPNNKTNNKTNNKPSTNSGVTAQTVSKGSISKFVECAKSYLGTPYVWGGTSRSGVDCSGLVYLAAQEAGLGTLPRTAKTLYGITSKINKSDLSAGDLVFFSSGSSISHVAIYVGDNQILHAVSEGSNTGVITSKLSQDYWKNHYYSSGRIMSNNVAEKRAQTRARARSR